MPISDDFAHLVCGVPHFGTPLGEIAGHLAASLRLIVNEIENLPSELATRVILYGPFLGRSVLELSFTALIGRLDPFRLLILREMQMRMPDSSLGERYMSAIQWSGDIRTSERADSNLWQSTIKMENIARTLFGRYYNEIFWIPAFTQVINSLTVEQGPWFDELRGYDPELICPSISSRSNNIYSTFSKGVHHEFVVPTNTFFSAEDVLEYLKSTLRFVCHTALVCNAVPTCHFKIDQAEALALYNHIQEIETKL